MQKDRKKLNWKLMTLVTHTRGWESDRGNENRVKGMRGETYSRDTSRHTVYHRVDY